MEMKIGITQKKHHKHSNSIRRMIQILYLVLEKKPNRQTLEMVIVKIGQIEKNLFKHV